MFKTLKKFQAYLVDRLSLHNIALYLKLLFKHCRQQFRITTHYVKLETFHYVFYRLGLLCLGCGLINGCIEGVKKDSSTLELWGGLIYVLSALFLFVLGIYLLVLRPQKKYSKLMQLEHKKHQKKKQSTEN